MSTSGPRKHIMARNECRDQRLYKSLSNLLITWWKNGKKTLVSHEVPVNPWGKVAWDIFTVDNQDYLVTVDYFSTFLEVDHFSRSTSKLLSRNSKHNLRDMEFRICLSVTKDRSLARMSWLSFLTIGNLSTSQALLNTCKVMERQSRVWTWPRDSWNAQSIQIQILI